MAAGPYEFRNAAAAATRRHGRREKCFFHFTSIGKNVTRTRNDVYYDDVVENSIIEKPFIQCAFPAPRPTVTYYHFPAPASSLSRRRVNVTE